MVLRGGRQRTCSVALKNIIAEVEDGTVNGHAKIRAGMGRLIAPSFS